MLRFPRILILLGLAAVALGLWTGLGLLRQDGTGAPPVPSGRVDLSEPEPAPGTDRTATAADPAPLRVAIAPVLSPEYSLQAYQPFVQYLSRKLGRLPQQLQGNSYQDVNNMVRYGQCDLGVVCSFAFVRGEREFGMEALAIPVVEGKTVYHSLILVRPDVAGASLLDLRGMSFASADLFSASGWLYPTMWLKEHGQDPNRFFGQHLITGSHDRSLQAVVSGYVDAAAVDSIIYDQMLGRDPGIARRARILDRSPPLGMPPVVTHPGMDRGLRGRMLAVLLGMHEDEEGRKALRTAGIDRFIAPDKATWDTVRAWAAALDARP